MAHTAPVPRTADQPIREILELAARLGEAMLSLGAAAADVTDTIRRTCRAFGLECQVDLTFTSILIAHDGTTDAPAVTVLRVVPSRTADYDRLTRLMELSEEIHHASATTYAEAIRDPRGAEVSRRRIAQIHGLLDQILLARHRYRPFVVPLALAAMAGGVALLLGGGPLIVLVAAATAMLIHLTTTLLGRAGLPPFFLQIAGAGVATVVAVLLLTVIPGLPVEITALPPGFVVASGVVVLLAGMSLVGAADDAINGFLVTSSGRVLEVVLLTAGIVVGIGAVMDIARRMGVNVTLVDGFTPEWPASVQVLGAAITAAAWAVASYAGPRAAAFSGIAGALAFTTYLALDRGGVPVATASAGGALIVGFLASALAARLRVPALVMTICGTVPLLPGLAIYRGMLSLTEGSVDAGIAELLDAALIGLGLASGVALGKIIARQTGLTRTLLPAHVRDGRLRKKRLKKGEQAPTTGVITIPVIFPPDDGAPGVGGPPRR